MKDMLKIVNQAWAWTGLRAAEIVCSNAFGNLIVRNLDGTFWRICPEDLSCRQIAADVDTYETLRMTADFQYDWEMTSLLERARNKLGDVSPERCYCLKMPAIFGGTYDEPNLGTISRSELIEFAGDVAEQIKKAPDGSHLQLLIENRRESDR